jgi:hypothetical protein
MAVLSLAWTMCPGPSCSTPTAQPASRHRIVSLLGSIAIGLDNNYLPGRYDPEEDRASLARARGAAGDMAKWTAEAKDDEERAWRGSYRRLAEEVLHEITRSPI